MQAVRVADAGIITVTAKSGVSVGTEKAWRALSLAKGGQITGGIPGAYSTYPAGEILPAAVSLQLLHAVHSPQQTYQVSPGGLTPCTDPLWI